MELPWEDGRTKVVTEASGVHAIGGDCIEGMVRNILASTFEGHVSPRGFAAILVTHLSGRTILKRRHVLPILLGSTSLLALAACGSSLAPKASLQTHKWSDEVLFEKIQFAFQSVYFTDTYYNFVHQPTRGSFLVLHLKLTNRSGSPIRYELLPVYALLDADGASYQPNDRHTLAMNMGKPDRLPLAQSMNPNVTYTHEVIFEVPKRAMKLQVMVPNSARLRSSHSISISGPYFIVDLQDELKRTL